MRRLTVSLFVGVLAITVAAVTMVLLQSSGLPSRSDSEHAVWLAAATAELSAHPNWRIPNQGAPVADYRHLPGLGSVSYVTVYPPSPRSSSSSMVVFQLGSAYSATDLAYVLQHPRPYDTCDRSLGGPWVLIAPSSRITGNCPKGFMYAPGP